MRLNPTRSRSFVVVSQDADDNGHATELGAATEESRAGLIAFGFIKQMQSEGFHNQRYFVIHTKSGETKEYKVDRNGGRGSIEPAAPITQIYC